MTATPELTASLEDYLETIYLLIEEFKVARSKDIAGRLKVKSSSVTGALRNLSAMELINYEPYGFVTLTKQGEKAAVKIKKKHEILRQFFANILNIDEEEAEEAACKIEHVIPKSVLNRMQQLSDFMNKEDTEGESWLSKFNSYCDSL